MSWFTRRTAPRPATRARLAAEELGPRAMPAVLVAVEGDVLRFTGTDGDDYVRINGQPGVYMANTFTAGDTVEFLWLINDPAVRSIRFDGFGGNDTFINDTALPLLAFGGDGDDSLIGGTGADELRGGPGHDTLHGNAGDDTLVGGQGDDTLRGGTGNDYLTGGDGNDTMYGGDGDDEMYGWDGDDTMQGGYGTDDLHGGAGNNTLAQDFLAPQPTAHDALKKVEDQMERARKVEVERMMDKAKEEADQRIMHAYDPPAKKPNPV